MNKGLIFAGMCLDYSCIVHVLLIPVTAAVVQVVAVAAVVAKVVDVAAVAGNSPAEASDVPGTVLVVAYSSAGWRG